MCRAMEEMRAGAAAKTRENLIQSLRDLGVDEDTLKKAVEQEQNKAPV